MAIRMKCETCGNTVTQCERCQVIMPPTTHGNRKLCDDCKVGSQREYYRVKQGFHRAAKLRRLEAIENGR